MLNRDMIETIDYLIREIEGRKDSMGHIGLIADLIDLQLTMMEEEKGLQDGRGN